MKSGGAYDNLWTSQFHAVLMKNFRSCTLAKYKQSLRKFDDDVFHAFITHIIHFGSLLLSYNCFHFCFSWNVLSAFPSAKAHSSPNLVSKLSALDDRRGFRRALELLKGIWYHMAEHPHIQVRKPRPRGLAYSEQEAHWWIGTATSWATPSHALSNAPHGHFLPNLWPFIWPEMEVGPSGASEVPPWDFCQECPGVLIDCCP